MHRSDLCCGPVSFRPHPHVTTALQVRLAKLAATGTSLDDFLAQLQHTVVVDSQPCVEDEATGSVAWVGPRALVSGSHDNAALRLWHVDEVSKLQLRHTLRFAADPPGTLVRSSAFQKLALVAAQANVQSVLQAPCKLKLTLVTHIDSW